MRLSPRAEDQCSLLCSRQSVGSPFVSLRLIRTLRRMFFPTISRLLAVATSTSSKSKSTSFLKKSSMSGFAPMDAARSLIAARQQKQKPPASPSPSYASLPHGQNGHSLLTYVWIDGTQVQMRSKTLVVEKEPKDIKEIPFWQFDGSSTYQAEAGDSDMTLKPVAMCRDPFFQGRAKLILCEVLDKNGKPATGSNYREKCAKIVEKTKHLDPWFAFEQEYTLYSRATGKPYGWPTGGSTLPPQGPYYCAVGDGNVFGRDVVDKHLHACLYAGLRIGGINAEVMPSQWEFQIGPASPLVCCDHLWLGRYIMHRVGEDFGASLNLDPKPLDAWNGAGNHCNFSTTLTRGEGGIKHIEEAVKKLSRNHQAHIEVYDPSGGVENRRRLSGKYETASIDKFSWAVGSRNVSVRIPRSVGKAGKGHVEDRRPSADCDPYRVVERILRTISTDDKDL